MDIKFKKLEKNDVEVRPEKCSSAYVELLLHTTPRVVMSQLDAAVGQTGWQRDHKIVGNTTYCGIGIKDGNEWIWKWDAGSSKNGFEREKTIASDSFKRAGFNWGIGRELYTAPKMRVPAALMPGYDGTSCYYAFVVTDLVYDDNIISSVSVDIMQKGVVINKITFTHDIPAEVDVPPVPSTPATPVKPAVSPAPTATVKPTVSPTTAPLVSNDDDVIPFPADSSSEPVKMEANVGDIADDEVILMGNCKGKKYGECKDTPAFKSFLGWVKNSTTSYRDANQQEQFIRLKALAEANI